MCDEIHVKNRIRIFALSILAFVLACSEVRAADSDAKPAAVSFALVPPTVAGKLRELGGSKAAVAIIKAADAGLAQAPGALARVHTEGTLPHEGIWDQSV
jgi:hypothetical protein